MSFPETRPTLVSRLARGGSAADWQAFVRDYWGPVVRFAARLEKLPPDQAEDAAAETFLHLVKSTLLGHWQASPTGKLRSFLCGVVRNVLANRRRIDQGRKRRLAEVVESGGIPDLLPIAASPEPTVVDLDIFYQAWVDELLARTMKTLLAELHSEGRGDYFRALYGRVCEGLSAEEIGHAIGVPAATVENYLRVAKARLSRSLRDEVRKHLDRYSDSPDAEAELDREWAELYGHLERFGGLEESLRREAGAFDHQASDPQRSRSFLAVQTLLRNTDHSGSAPAGTSQKRRL
jgi:RNA polymerase sigma factor (sigma-70 family)